MIDPKTLDKYLKVKALAEQGAEGERDNARKIVEKMEQSFPGIREQADRRKKEQDSPAPQWDDPQPQPWRGGNWEDLFNFARGFVNEAYGFANTMANAYVGTHLVERNVSSATRRTRAGNVVISFSMPFRTYREASNLNEIQQAAFRQAMHEMLDAELDKILDD